MVFTRKGPRTWMFTSPVPQVLVKATTGIRLSWLSRPCKACVSPCFGNVTWLHWVYQMDLVFLGMQAFLQKRRDLHAAHRNDLPTPPPEQGKNKGKNISTGGVQNGHISPLLPIMSSLAMGETVRGEGFTTLVELILLQPRMGMRLPKVSALGEYSLVTDVSGRPPPDCPTSAHIVGTRKHQS